MSLAGALEQLQEEAICPICLEYMSEPVSIDCGHNFCRGCIAKYCQEKGLWADGTFSCPQCRASCHRSGFRPNRQLANIVESIRQLGLRGSAGTEPGTPLCAQHDERLKLFCEEDEEAICVVCRESLQHRLHTVYPIEEAAWVYKVGEAGDAGVPVLPCSALVHPGHGGAGGLGAGTPLPHSQQPWKAEEGLAESGTHQPLSLQRPSGSLIVELPRRTPIPLASCPPRRRGTVGAALGMFCLVGGVPPDPVSHRCSRQHVASCPVPWCFLGRRHFALQNLTNVKTTEKTGGVRRGLTLRGE